MVDVRPDEISAILRQQLAGFKSESELEEVGTVLQIGDGIARVYGLTQVQSGELVEFGNGLQGIVLNLEEDNVGVVLLGAYDEVKEGDTVRRTKKIASITKKGEEHFFELMKMPVPDGAHSADIYLIKLNVMQHLTLNEQMQLLDQFYQEQKDIIQDAQEVLNKLAKENSSDHWYASKKFELLLNQADVTIEWIEKFKQELRKA